MFAHHIAQHRAGQTGGTHSAGQIVSINAGPAVNPTQIAINYITAKATAQPNALGVYRNPLPLSNGGLVAAYTPASNWDTNVGTMTARVRMVAASSRASKSIDQPES